MNQSVSFGENKCTLRAATIADLNVVLHHRWSMFHAMGYHDTTRMDAMLSTSRPFFAERLADGRYRGWLVENSEHQVIAGGGIIIFDYHSNPGDPYPKRPFVVNMYTEPQYRRKGIARKLMETMIGWCRDQGFGSILLHASSEGKSLYEQLGFKETNEMRLMLMRRE